MGGSLGLDRERGTGVSTGPQARRARLEVGCDEAGRLRASPAAAAVRDHAPPKQDRAATRHAPRPRLMRVGRPTSTVQLWVADYSEV